MVHLSAVNLQHSTLPIQTHIHVEKWGENPVNMVGSANTQPSQPYASAGCKEKNVPLV